MAYPTDKIYIEAPYLDARKVMSTGLNFTKFCMDGRRCLIGFKKSSPLIARLLAIPGAKKFSHARALEVAQAVDWNEEEFYKKYPDRRIVLDEDAL